jgi:uncharacterized membrane protein YeaQ/YmgE (transglycosylase-associated protein family)
MLIVFVVVIGAIAGVITHLVLGEDGYSWFGEIILGIAGSILFGLLVGILAGARGIGLDGYLAGTGPLNVGVVSQVALGAAVGALIVEAAVVWLTFRSTGRGFGQTSRASSENPGVQ